MTFAPRSWPSRPGLAMSTRRGGMSRFLEQLDEHAKCGRGLQEGDVAVRARAGLRVDQLDALIAQIAQVLANIGRAEAQVMQARAAAFEKTRHGTVRIGRLEQLDQR